MMMPGKISIKFDVRFPGNNYIDDFREKKRNIPPFSKGPFGNEI